MIFCITISCVFVSEGRPRLNPVVLGEYFFFEFASCQMPRTAGTVEVHLIICAITSDHVCVYLFPPVKVHKWALRNIGSK